MRIEEALYAHLSTHAGLTALVGTRIYPQRLPQTPTLPAVTFFRVSGPTIQDFDGTAKTRARFQLDCWAEGDTAYADAHEVADQVIAALDGYGGQMGGAGGVWCDATLINDRDLPDPDTGWHRVSQDYEIWY